MAVVAVVALTAPALASVVTDLEGARAAGALDDMARRGYVQTSDYAADGGRYSYWWNRDTNSCVRLLTRDGRIAATKTTTVSDCGQKSSGGGNDAATAAIAGAAIIVGVAALSHKSHHRDDQEYNDSQSYAEFERGHRDGLYNHAFNDYSNKNEYRRGYDSGVRERGYQSEYRSDNYYDRGAPSTPQPVYFEDLIGARAAGATSDLGSRGFRVVDTFESGSNGAGTIWWNGRTRQCLQAITVDGHIDSMNSIQTHPRCR
jgi:hypothetical protein